MVRKIVVIISITVSILFVWVLTVSGCKTTPHENEFIVTSNNAKFLFMIEESRVLGEFIFYPGKSDITIQINDTMLTGEVLPFGDVTSYSLIYQKAVIKGNVTLKDNGSRQMVAISIPDGPLQGDIIVSDLQSDMQLQYGDQVIAGGWSYHSDKKTVTWDYQIGDSEYEVSITGKGRRAFYSFIRGAWDNDTILIFLLLEFIRQQA